MEQVLCVLLALATLVAVADAPMRSPSYPAPSALSTFGWGSKSPASAGRGTSSSCPAPLSADAPRSFPTKEKGGAATHELGADIGVAGEHGRDIVVHRAVGPQGPEGREKRPVLLVPKSLGNPPQEGVRGGCARHVHHRARRLPPGQLIVRGARGG